jgi:hypothetical protein
LLSAEAYKITNQKKKQFLMQKSPSGNKKYGNICILQNINHRAQKQKTDI